MRLYLCADVKVGWAIKAYCTAANPCGLYGGDCDSDDACYGRIQHSRPVSLVSKFVHYNHI